MCVILDLCKTRGRGKKTWNGAPFLISTGAPKVLSEFAPRGYVILDTPLQMFIKSDPRISSFTFLRVRFYQGRDKHIFLRGQSHFS